MQQSKLTNWKDFLDLMEVPDTFYKNVFLLGNFSTHVTIYSQQVRAVNLVEALFTVKKLTAGSRVAVVGAGIAGITFSKGAVLKGASVSIIEKNFSNAFGMQFNNRQRYIHPYIYDWPQYESKGDVTNLPYLNWTAGICEKVASELRSEWEQFRDNSRYKPQIQEFYNANSVKIKGNIAATGVTVAWNNSIVGNMELEFDVVIIAVGFGVEKQEHGKWSYWDDDALDAADVAKKTWLISGYGDGALTDLMRLCLQDFRHDVIVREFSKNKEAHDYGKQLLEFENSSSSTISTELRNTYKALNIESLKVILKGKLRNVTVSINCSLTELYSKKSSILNRLIISQLDKLGAFKLCDEGKIISSLFRVIDNNTEVEFENGKKLVFDSVLMRHGPSSVIKQEFEDIFLKSKKLKEKWATFSYILDKTRYPLWEKDSFAEVLSGDNYFSTRHQFVESSKSIWNLSGETLQLPLIIGHVTHRGRKNIPHFSSNYAFLDDFGDIDAVFETMIYLARLYPGENIKKLPADIVTNKDLAGQSLIVIGGPLGNDEGIGGNWVTATINQSILKTINYELEEIPTMILNNQKLVTEFASDGSIKKDYGLISRSKNPWDETKRILCFQGIHTFGGLGAVMALTNGSQAPYNCNMIVNKFGHDPLFYALVNTDVQSGTVLPPILLENDIKAIL